MLRRRKNLIFDDYESGINYDSSREEPQVPRPLPRHPLTVIMPCCMREFEESITLDSISSPPPTSI